MGTEYTKIDDGIRNWIERQQVFFVATAPTAANGLVNVSPKGLDSLRVTGPKEILYVDTGGSGIETVAHLKDNGRITLMMCAFDGPPKIFRFYGRGFVFEPHDHEFDSLLARFPKMPAARNIVRIDVERIIDSCGFGVPLYDFRQHRDSLLNYFSARSEEEILDYRRRRNRTSLEGLRGLDIPDEPV